MPDRLTNDNLKRKCYYRIRNHSKYWHNMISLKDLINFSALIFGAPYFFGFVYLSSYFGYFGIGILEASVSVEYVYVSAFFAILRGAEAVGIDWTAMPEILVIIVFLMLLTLCVWGLLQSRKIIEKFKSQKAVHAPSESLQVSRTRHRQMLMFIFLYPIVLVVLFLFGSASGRDAAENDLRSMPMVSVALSKPGFPVLLDHSRHRLVFTSRESFFLWETSGRSIEDGWLVRLPIHESHVVYSERPLQRSRRR